MRWRRARSLKASDVRDAVAATSINSVVGPVKWGGQGPFKNVSKTPLVLGQWGKGRKYKVRTHHREQRGRDEHSHRRHAAAALKKNAMTLLALHAVSKSYGALKVTDDITLSVAEGETLGILGPNGAGKTTLFNLISGDVRADAGRVEYAGRDVTRLKPHQRCHAGIGRSYQVPQPFGNMSVFENLVTAACFGGQQTEREAWQTAHEVLTQTGLMAHANKPAGGLTLLDRKRLELARALATRPQLLLLDEIAGGLTEPEAAVLVDELKRIKARGMTMIWIEHVVHALLSLADRLFVINFGQKLAEGAPRVVMNDAQVRWVYMGMEA
jgi:branched-chain amino acid transport system ATP-binding protein